MFQYPQKTVMARIHDKSGTTADLVQTISKTAPRSEVGSRGVQRMLPAAIIGRIGTRRQELGKTWVSKRHFGQRPGDMGLRDMPEQVTESRIREVSHAGRLGDIPRVTVEEVSPRFGTKVIPLDPTKARDVIFSTPERNQAYASEVSAAKIWVAKLLGRPS